MVVLYVARVFTLARGPWPRSQVDSHTVSKRFKSLPILGSLHGSDIPNIYGPGDMTDYLIHFVTNLDPNGGSSPQWPQYTTSSRLLLTFVDDPVTNITITRDTYRTEGIGFLTKISLAHPILGT